jgi:hypothetical protein
MPSDIKEGDYEYRDMMDQLNEVIQKYEETYDILLCGAYFPGFSFLMIKANVLVCIVCHKCSVCF